MRSRACALLLAKRSRPGASDGCVEASLGNERIIGSHVVGALLAERRGRS